jgi:hypothetical protein
MGMDKSGTQQLPASSPTKITGWTVRSGHPDTSIVSDAMVMNGAGTGTVTFRGGTGSVNGTFEFRAYHNGVGIGSWTNKNTVGSVTSVTVANGDTIELYAEASSAFPAQRVVSEGSTNTYIYFTPD